MEKASKVETRIYVGINDSVERKQLFETERYVSILKSVCMNYHVPFSCSLQNGGYFHEDGTYVDETSLLLTMIDADPTTVEEIAKDLCVFFRQESVMVTETPVRTYFIRERL